MSSFRKTFVAIAGLLVLLIAMPSLLGQPGAYYPQKAGLFGGWGGTQWNSRQIPGGSVVDPGSQVLYIVDTGLNLREEERLATGDSELGDAQYGDPLPILKPELYGPNNSLVGINQSFLSITNTHPTQAVTVHFRYFNDECEDLLDFLVVLTCNDTLLFDPFNFIVPETTENTRTRIFGPSVDGGVLDPILARQFGSGRFLIFATASGTSTDSPRDDNAELRFPYEFRNLWTSNNYDHCYNLRSGQYFGTEGGIDFRNLHVFNASALAFNYLIGVQTQAKLVSEQGQPPISQAWGLNAWTRPAIDASWDHRNQETAYDLLPYSEKGLPKYENDPNQGRSEGRRFPDVDGPPLVARNDWRILTGGELVPDSASSPNQTIRRNYLYLRNDVHGGDSGRGYDLRLRENLPRARQGARTNAGDGIMPDFHVWWGGLGAPTIFGLPQDNQRFCFLSIQDDYNGSGTSFGGSSDDRSYNVGAAETTYVLQVYDNSENLFDITEDAPPNISPFPEGVDVSLKIVVDCLRVWVTTVKVPSTSVEDLAVSELNKITAESGGPAGHLNKAVDAQRDASRGWIRFVRDNTMDGTWESFNPGGDADTPPDALGSFVTIGYQTLADGGLGAAWWLPAVATDPWVNATGDPSCDGLCPNGATHTNFNQDSPFENP